MDLRVDPESLFEAAAGLRATLSFVGDWNRSKTGLTAAAPAAGHAVMADAIEQFCDEWGYGFDNIADELEEIAQALVTAATAYLDTEQAISNASGGSG